MRFIIEIKNQTEGHNILKIYFIIEIKNKQIDSESLSNKVLMLYISYIACKKTSISVIFVTLCQFETVLEGFFC